MKAVRRRLLGCNEDDVEDAARLPTRLLTTCWTLIPTTRLALLGPIGRRPQIMPRVLDALRHERRRFAKIVAVRRFLEDLHEDVLRCLQACFSVLGQQGFHGIRSS